MKITIDSILGSAKRIKSQKQPEDKNLGNKRKEIKTDSISIDKRINSRIDSIDKEFREIQTSLTRNQIIRNGLWKLKTDLSKGGENIKNILDETKFEDNNVLRTFIGDSINEKILNIKFEKNNELISSDIEKLKVLHIELDNLMASNLVKKEKIDNIMHNIDNVFKKVKDSNIDSFTRIRADVVMKLIK